MIEERNVNFHSDTFVKNSSNDTEGVGGYYCDMKNSGSNENNDADNKKSKYSENENEDSDYKNNNLQNNTDNNNKKEIENNVNLNNKIKESTVRNKKESEIRCYNRLLVVPTAGAKSSQTENLKIEIAKSISSSRLT